METRSQADLKKVGAWKYAEDPTTEIMCVAIKRDERPTEIWINTDFHHLLNEEATEELGKVAISAAQVQGFIWDADRIEAHNA